jgi:hypothetical protein
MKNLFKAAAFSACVVALGAAAVMPLAGQGAGKLIVFSDLALFAGPGKPENCFMRNRYKKGDNVGFRVLVVDGATGQPEPSAEVVVHLNYGGKAVDVPARYRGVIPAGGRGTAIPQLWTAKWVVPEDAPTGILSYTVTAKDKNGRTGEFKELPNDAGKLTIVE